MSILLKQAFYDYSFEDAGQVNMHKIFILNNLSQSILFSKKLFLVFFYKDAAVFK